MQRIEAEVGGSSGGGNFHGIGGGGERTVVVRVLGIIARIVAQELKAGLPIDLCACLEDEEGAQLGAVCNHRHLGVGRGCGRGGAHILAADLTLEAVHSACCGLVDGEVGGREHIVVLRNLIDEMLVGECTRGIRVCTVDHAPRRGMQVRHIDFGSILTYSATHILVDIGNGGLQRIDAVGADIRLYNPIASHITALISIDIGIGSRRI